MEPDGKLTIDRSAFLVLAAAMAGASCSNYHTVTSASSDDGGTADATSGGQTFADGSADASLADASGDAEEAPTEASVQDAPQGDSKGDVGTVEAGCGSTQHSNGVGGVFFDCIDAGSLSQALALDACNGYITGAVEGLCAATPCANPSNELLVCSTSPKNCTCWAYAGPNAGHVTEGGDASTASCHCPVSTDPTWQ